MMNTEEIIYFLYFPVIGIAIVNFIYYSLASKKIKQIDQNRVLFKESIAFILKYLLPIVIFSYLSVLILFGVVKIYTDVYTTSYEYQSLFYLAGFIGIIAIAVFASFLAPVYQSIDFLKNQDYKQFFKKFIFHSSIIGILSSIFYTFFIIIITRGSPLMIAIVIPIFFTPYCIVFVAVSFLAIIILLLRQKNFYRTIFILSIIVLISSSIYNYWHFKQGSIPYYSKQAVRTKNISFCDKLLIPTYDPSLGVRDCKINYMLANNYDIKRCADLREDSIGIDLCSFYYALYKNDCNLIVGRISCYPDICKEVQNYCNFILDLQNADGCKFFKNYRYTYNAHTFEPLYWKADAGSPTEWGCRHDFQIRNRELFK